MRPQSSGNYLLEFAAVLAVLLPVFFGALDISSALHAYNAARSASTTASRCVFPTDGRCVQAAAYAPSDRLYDWYRGDRVTRFAIPFARYSGTGFWLRGAQYRWNQYEAKVYTSVSYDVTQQSYQAFRVRNKREQPLLVMVQHAALPRIHGDDPQHPQRFSYRSPSERAAPFSGELSTRISAAAVTADRDGRIVITPPAWASDPNFGRILCVRSKGFDTGVLDGEPAVSQRCERWYFGDEPAYPIAFWISGRAVGGVTGAESGVGISMSFTMPNGSTLEYASNLGGQFFGNPGPGHSSVENFDPRGFTEDGVSKTAFREIGGTAKVPPGWATAEVMVPARARAITLHLKGSAQFPASLTYTIEGARAFAPVMALAEFVASCSGEPCEDPAGSCVLEHGGQLFGEGPGRIPYDSVARSPVSAVAISPERLTTEKEQIGPPQPFSSLEAATEALNPEAGCGVVVSPVGPAAGARIDEEPCPPDPEFGESPREAKHCQPAFPGAATNISHTTSFIIVPQSEAEASAFPWEFSYQLERCADRYGESKFIPPAGLTRYEEFHPASLLRGPSPEIRFVDLEHTNGRDPRPLHDAGGEFGCPEFEIASQRFDAALAGTFFAEDQPALLPEPRCMDQRLQTEAIAAGLPPFGFFQPDPPQSPLGSPFRTVDTLEDPTCVNYSVVTTVENPREIASDLPAGTAPSECPGVDCFSVYSGEAAGTGSSVALDLKQAERWGEQELSSIFPSARFDCVDGSPEPRCAAVKTSLDDSSISVTSSIRIPFYLLGGKTHTVSHTESRKLERGYVR